jgi:hypothetical protein
MWKPSANYINIQKHREIYENAWKTTNYIGVYAWQSNKASGYMWKPSEIYMNIHNNTETQENAWKQVRT